MKRRLLLFLFGLAGVWNGAAAADDLAALAAPLEEGVPEVAVVKLKARLEALPADAAERSAVLELYGRALLEAGKPQEALKAVAGTGSMVEARALATLGRWQQALEIFEKLPETEATLLARSTCLTELGRLSDAIALLENAARPTARLQLRLSELYLQSRALDACAKLLAQVEPTTPFEKKWKQYNEAVLLLAQGHPAYALGRFEDLQKNPQQLPPNLVAGVALGISDSRAKVDGLAAADEVLEQFIHKYPDHPDLGAVFRKLNEIYESEANPSDRELQKWAQREPAVRAGYASYYLARFARRAGRYDRALKALRQFSERFPRHPVLSDALLLEGELLIQEGRLEEAQKSLEAAMRHATSDLQRAEIEMTLGILYFRSREFVLAATLFRAAGERAPEVWERAVFNSALSWLHQGNSARFLADYRELTERRPDSPYRAELFLEEGLLQARHPETRRHAEATLQRFIREFPKNRRVPEARLALAELRFEANDPAGAGRYLRVVNDNPPASPEVSEQADYLAIFVAAAAVPRDDEKVIALCQQYLQRYPEGKKEPEVRMKLAEIYFAREDFASAQNQLEILVRQHPTSPLVEAALFLAGQSSIKRMSEGGVDRAIVLFEEVVKQDGPLKYYARLQQAKAQSQLGKQHEAILVYDAILRASPPAEVEWAALAGKANCLVELGQKEPALLEQALAIYAELAEKAASNVNWRSLALHQKGRCLEALNRPDEALAAYYDVLQMGAAQPVEYFWFYKAGFDAGRLCEERKQWKSAIAIYQKLAAVEGPRSEQARALVNHLRLEHFIWD